MVPLYVLYRFATWFEIGMYMLDREMRYLRFFEINRYNTSFK